MRVIGGVYGSAYIHKDDGSGRIVEVIDGVKSWAAVLMISTGDHASRLSAALTVEEAREVARALDAAVNRHLVERGEQEG